MATEKTMVIMDPAQRNDLVNFLGTLPHGFGTVIGQQIATQAKRLQEMPTASIKFEDVPPAESPPETPSTPE